jgi:hypothetical protein
MVVGASDIYYFNGNVGIGNKIPIYPFDVSGAIRCYGNLYFNNPGYNQYGSTTNYPSNPNLLISAGNGTLTSIPNLNGGIYVQAQGLTIAGENLYWGISPYNVYSFGSSIQIDGGRSKTAEFSHGQIRFYTANSQRFVIDEFGNIGIGTGSPEYTLDVNGSIRLNSVTLINGVITGSLTGTATNATNVNTTASTDTTAQYPIFVPLSTTGSQGVKTSTKLSYVASTGILTASGFTISSDYRIKKDIVSLVDTPYNIDQLTPVKYTNLRTEKEDMGFIAHEVQEVFPFLVNGIKDGKEKQSINYNGFISLLVKEVQCLKKENKELKINYQELKEIVDKLVQK